MGIEKLNKSNIHEHLRSDIKPIIACIGEYKQHLMKENPDLSKTLYEVFYGNQDIENADNIDPELSDKSREAGFIGPYAISTVDSRDKFSRGYDYCTGLIVAGLDKNTQENISFISHQTSKSIFEARLEEIKFKETGVKEKNMNFFKNLEESLEEIKNKSAEKTIDIVIIGGMYIKDEFEKREYTKAIKLLEQKIFEQMEFTRISLI